MAPHKVVTHDQWVAARKKHLAKEKEFIRLRDQLSRERRDLPWELVEKEYTLEGEKGRQTLGEVFEGRSQLAIYHALFNPATAGPHMTWTTDAPCFVCSFWMDNFNGIAVHLNHRDITMAAVSLAPFATLAAYKRRMGWSFPWYSSVGSDFNFDHRVSFTPDELQKGKADYDYGMNPWSTLSTVFSPVRIRWTVSRLNSVLNTRRPSAFRRCSPMGAPAASYVPRVSSRNGEHSSARVDIRVHSIPQPRATDQPDARPAGAVKIRPVLPLLL